MKQRYIEAGRIGSTHGIKGEVRITPYVDSADFLKTFQTLYINQAPIKITAARTHKSLLIAKLEGYDDVSAAMTLKNSVVYIDREDARLTGGAFFLSDIIGARVLQARADSAGAEELVDIGYLADIIEAPAANVYVVRSDKTNGGASDEASPPDRLIPAVPEFIKKTDVDAGLIVVRLIEGM